MPPDLGMHTACIIHLHNRVYQASDLIKQTNMKQQLHKGCFTVLGLLAQTSNTVSKSNNDSSSINGNVTVVIPDVAESGGGCEGASPSPNPTPPCSETESPGWAGSAWSFLGVGPDRPPLTSFNATLR